MGVLILDSPEYSWRGRSPARSHCEPRRRRRLREIVATIPPSDRAYLLEVLTTEDAIRAEMIGDLHATGFVPATTELLIDAWAPPGHLRVDQGGRIMASIDVSNTVLDTGSGTAVPEEFGYDHDDLASERDHSCGLGAAQFRNTESSLDGRQQRVMRVGRRVRHSGGDPRALFGRV